MITGLLGLGLAACITTAPAADPAATATARAAPTIASPTTATASAASSAAPTTATASAASSAAPTTATVASSRRGGTKACLMTHICGCNLGCTRVPLDPASLREGATAVAETGPYEGKSLRVVKEIDASGAPVFALSDRGPAYSCERAVPEARSLLGFLCSNKDGGPVPANACAKGCE